MALTKAQRARIEGYERDNRECSRIILADIEKYGGEESLAVQWARAIQRKQPDYWPEGDLFDEKETAECQVPAVSKWAKVAATLP